MAGILTATVGMGGFVAVTRTYDSGAGTDTIPNGPSQLVVEIWGGGNVGGAGDAGIPAAGGGSGSGGYSKKTFVLTSGNWGQTLNYSTGASNSTSSNGTFPTVFSLSALRGSAGQDGASGGNQGAGGTASGGDVNTTGNGSGGVVRAGAGAPNGGGDSATGVGTTPGGGGAGGSAGGSAGQIGANGRAKFTYR